MNEARDAFARVDATALNEHDSYDIHIGAIESENATSVTVEFEEFEADSEEELEAQLDKRAAEVIEESDVEEVGPHFGYEVVREDGETSRMVSFVVTQPHL